MLSFHRLAGENDLPAFASASGLDAENRRAEYGKFRQKGL